MKDWIRAGLAAVLTGLLKPAKLLPNCEQCVKLCESKKCDSLDDPAECRKCSKECLKDCNWTCKENDCLGFECINTYQEEGVDDTSLRQISRSEAEIFVDQVYDLENSRTIADQTLLPGFELTDVIEIDYFILVKNAGDIKLEDIWINDTLPERMVYTSAAFYDDQTLRHRQYYTRR